MQSPLAAWHSAHGAEMTDDRAVALPERFADVEREYRAVRDAAGIIDLSFRVQIAASGEDRVSFLQGMLSNDVESLQPGQGCPATLLTDQGRIVADLRVYALADSLMLDLDARITDKTVAALERFIIADDVELADLSADQTTLAVQGPLASRLLEAAGASAGLTEDYRHAEARLADTAVRIVRASETGLDGFNILVPRARVEAVWHSLLEAGRPLGACPVGLGALTMLRIEAGIPWYGVDMDEDRIVLEVGLDHALSFNKGCYLGQEVVERASARGRVNRRLSGLLVQGTEPPHSGDTLFADTRQVGWITSATQSPRFGRPIALGYVRREHLEPGTRLRIDRNGTPVIAEVAVLPFPHE